MKLVIRLVILIVVALFLFGGGFWFGNQWRGDPDGTSLEDIKTDTPENETAAVQPSDTKPETMKTVSPTQTLKPQPVDVRKQESLQKTVGEREADKIIKDPPPSVEESPDAAKESNVQSPSSKPDKPPASAAPEKTASVAPQDVSPDKPAATQSAAPKEKSQTPAAGEPQPKGEQAKESLSLIVTPEDLGENQIVYSVLAGTFLDKDLAQVLLKRLKAKQYPAFMVSAWDNKSQLWYTVRVGRFTDVLQAQEAAKMLLMKERIPATVYGLGSLRYDEIPEAAGASLTESPANKTKPAPPEKEPTP